MERTNNFSLDKIVVEAWENNHCVSTRNGSWDDVKSLPDVVELYEDEGTLFMLAEHGNGKQTFIAVGGDYTPTPIGVGADTVFGYIADR